MVTIRYSGYQEHLMFKPMNNLAYFSVERLLKITVHNDVTGEQLAIPIFGACFRRLDWDYRQGYLPMYRFFSWDCPLKLPST
jgi:hypothetical protein